MNSFEISKVIILITTIIMIVTIGVIVANFLPTTNQGSQTQQIITQQYKKCDHEFVMTSKWDSYHQQYKTISKCIKCGLEIE